MDELQKQQIIDDEHLRLLRIGYLILGGMSGFMILIPLVYVFIGFFFLSNTSMPINEFDAEMPAEMLGYIFITIGIAISVILIIATVINLYTARALRIRKQRMVILISAGMSCFNIPWGTALGILTFVTLNRESVKVLFENTVQNHKPETEIKSYSEQ